MNFCRGDGLAMGCGVPWGREDEVQQKRWEQSRPELGVPSTQIRSHIPPQISTSFSSIPRRSPK